MLEHEAEYPSQWSAIESIASKISCTAETLRRWLRRAERDSGRHPAPTNDEPARLKGLERENRELCKASSYFALAELDRWFKP